MSAGLEEEEMSISNESTVKVEEMEDDCEVIESVDVHNYSKQQLLQYNNPSTKVKLKKNGNDCPVKERNEANDVGIKNNDAMEMVKYCDECKGRSKTCSKCTKEITDHLREISNISPKYILHIVKYKGGLGISTADDIPQGVRFGPVFEYTRRRKESWLHSVRISSTSYPEHNLVSVIIDGNMFYRSNKLIKKDEELIVHIDEDFIKSIGLDPQKCYPYICVPCALGFTRKIYFIKHKMNCQYKPQNGIVKCPFCEVHLTQPQYLDSHMRRCNKRYEKDLDTQVSDHALEGALVVRKKFKCTYCSHAADTHSLLREHYEYHHKANYLCGQCGKTLTSSQSLKKHMLVHNPEKKYECGHCDFKTHCRSSLKAHIQAKHLNWRKFACHLCSLKFFRKCGLAEHLKVHSGNRDYTCKVCEKSFTRVDNLRVHMNMHLGITFNCPKCEYETHYKGIIKEHLTKKHNFSRRKIDEHIKKILESYETSKGADIA